ncbi:hypothetical protein MKW94_029216 [Papaver nudicaule]|uniref:Bms1-type G domain-containing protein n=1 Tax=Papaver nudicaule TaxID=74823 RepID=A0AA41VN50_PAPNU|nr:hypothetical protein [Papaver nudicaule]
MKKRRRRADGHTFLNNKKRRCDDNDHCDDNNTCSVVNSSLSPSTFQQFQHRDAFKHKEPTSINNTTEEDQPPYVVVVHGPPKVGKSVLIKSLLNHFTKQNLSDIPWPFTIVSGKNHRRIQFVECANDINSMIDAAKYADAVIFIFDAVYGFEMVETVEFLNLLNNHGMPKVIGVLTRLDCLADVEKVTEAKKSIIDRFLTETYQEAALFCLSSFNFGLYPDHDIQELASFISAMEFHPLSWRAAHPYLLVDRVEDATPTERVQMDTRCNRDLVLYGYLRGCYFKKGTKVHIAGAGDFLLAGITSLIDPFPLLSVDSVKVPTADVFKFCSSSILYKEAPMEIAGFTPGTHLRCEVHGIPFDMVENHDPYRPILVGGISHAEENAGYMQATIKVHSEQQNLLRSRDPIIVSIGWRRYQTIPIYAMEDCSGRLQMLNYTPKDMPCHAMFWGPLALPNTGAVAVQTLGDNQAAFRILATAVILDCNNAAKIVKRRRRIGTPCKTFKKTAFVKDMFKSNHEIATYEGATIWTASRIRGKVNKQSIYFCAVETKVIERLRRKDSQLRGGIAKCTFEHKIRASDIIYMSAWTQVEVPRFFSPLTATDHIWLVIKARKYSNHYKKKTHRQHRETVVEMGRQRFLVRCLPACCESPTASTTVS